MTRIWQYFTRTFQNSCFRIKISAENDFKKGWIDFTEMGDPRSYPACFKWLSNIEAHHEALKNNGVPSLVIHGEKDPMVPFEQGKMLAANLKNSTFKSHNFGHILEPLNEQNKMLDMISDFIKRNNQEKFMHGFKRLKQRFKHHEHHVSDYNDDSLESSCVAFIQEFLNMATLLYDKEEDLNK